MRSKLKRLSRKEWRIYFQLVDFVDETMELLDKDFELQEQKCGTCRARVADFELWPTKSREYQIFKKVSDDINCVSYGVVIPVADDLCAVMCQYCNWVKDDFVWKRGDIADNIARDLLMLLSYEDKN